VGVLACDLDGLATGAAGDIENAVVGREIEMIGDHLALRNAERLHERRELADAHGVFVERAVGVGL
jgi:hypothetical protein